MGKHIVYLGTLILLVYSEMPAQTNLKKMVISNGGGGVAGISNMSLTVGQGFVGNTTKEDQMAQIGFWVLASTGDEEATVAINRVNPEIELSTNNYPNPFTERTTFYLRLSQREKLRIIIYSSEGNIVQEIFDDWMPQGLHAVEWFPGNIPEGQYIAEMTSSLGYSKVSRIIFVR